MSSWQYKVWQLRHSSKQLLPWISHSTDEGNPLLRRHKHRGQQDNDSVSWRATELELERESSVQRVRSRSNSHGVQRVRILRDEHVQFAMLVQLWC